jgi:hypothetical protein
VGSAVSAINRVHASQFVPSIFIEQEPQTPSRQERRKVVASRGAAVTHGGSDSSCANPRWRYDMGSQFKRGDHVSWNSEAGRVSGRVIRVHTQDVDYKGHTHHATEDEPQYEIKSDKTDHIAMHKGPVLKKLSAK